MVISQVAYYLAASPEIKMIILLTPFGVLSKQVITIYFSVSAPHSDIIVHIAASDSENDMVRLFFNMKDEELKSTAVVIDEVDSFVLVDCLLTYRMKDLRKQSQSDEVGTYCLDILEFLCQFKFVISFCALV